VKRVTSTAEAMIVLLLFAALLLCTGCGRALVKEEGAPVNVKRATVKQAIGCRLNKAGEVRCKQYLITHDVIELVK
jgi:outer membrane lipopolysaccharide assembly protein LptE/RlpB